MILLNILGSIELMFFLMNIPDYVLNWILSWIIFRPDSMKKFHSNSPTNMPSRFPKNLDVPVKTTLLGAAILIDFAFFENSEWFLILPAEHWSSIDKFIFKAADK